MKKNLLFIVFLVMSFTAAAQCGSGCPISGSGVGMFSVPQTTGANYFWSTTGGLSIVGSNTGSSVQVTGSGTLYITKYMAGAAPCCSSILVGSSCDISINTVTELNVFGSNNVIFMATTNVGPGTTITGSSFVVYYESGTTSTYLGMINAYGNPQINIPVNCTNRVTRVVVTVTAANSGFTCSRTFDQQFIPPVCGTDGLGMTSNNAVEGKTDFSEDVIKVEVLKYDIHRGNKELIRTFGKNEKINLSELAEGNYVIRTYSQNGEITTKKIFVQSR